MRGASRPSHGQSNGGQSKRKEKRNESKASSERGDLNQNQNGLKESH